MPTYHYECDTCQATETLEQPMGSSKTHDCDKCGGVCRRVIKPPQELSTSTTTPGAAAQRSFESRKCDEQLTQIRRSRNLAPNTEPDQLAADRHMAKKNGILKDK